MKMQIFDDKKNYGDDDGRQACHDKDEDDEDDGDEEEEEEGQLSSMG